MRAYILIIITIFLNSCHTRERQIPVHSDIGDILEPIWWEGDTTELFLTDYFSDISHVKKITVSKGIEIQHENDSASIFLMPDGKVFPLGNLMIRYDGFNYDIPLLLKPNNQKNLPIIFTDKVRHDTIFLQSDRPVEKWAVYLQNHQLRNKYTISNGKQLKIIIPAEARDLKSGILRAWAVNESGISNGVWIPIAKGNVIQDLQLLDSMPGFTAYKEKENIRQDSVSGKTIAQIFARKYQKFPQLHELVLSKQASNATRFSDLRLLANNNGKIPGFPNADSTTSGRLIQLLAFHMTVPGIPQIYPIDSLRLPAIDTDELETVRNRSILLNELYQNSMPLQYGDFIPLRIEDDIYAYMRSYFGKEVIVVFNKGKETVTLKLDLPDIERYENFNSLFNNRFSYDNSRLILDVPANGVEVIFN